MTNSMEHGGQHSIDTTMGDEEIQPRIPTTLGTEITGRVVSVVDANPGLSPEAAMEALENELSELDNAIIEAIKRRTELSQQVDQTRVANGGLGFAHSQELGVVTRFSELGSEGGELALALLRMSRGPLGHR